MVDRLHASKWRKGKLLSRCRDGATQAGNESDRRGEGSLEEGEVDITIFNSYLARPRGCATPNCTLFFVVDKRVEPAYLVFVWIDACFSMRVVGRHGIGQIGRSCLSALVMFGRDVHILTCWRLSYKLESCFSENRNSGSRQEQVRPSPALLPAHTYNPHRHGCM